MRICHVTHGILPVPPPGWGGVELTVSNYRHYCEMAGHDFAVVNLPDAEEALAAVHAFRPDVVHLHDERKVGIMAKISATVKIVCCHSPMNLRTNPFVQQFAAGDFLVACLSRLAVTRYSLMGIPSHRLFLFPNGARADEIVCESKPRRPGRWLCLGRITARKRQHLFQWIDRVDFVGPFDQAYHEFKPWPGNLIGELPRYELNQRMTRWDGMILLSKTEACTPQVVMEGLMAGLDVIISEACVDNLDTSESFIRVLNEDEVENPIAILKAMECQQNRSQRDRKQIRYYAEQNFDWEKLVWKYLHFLESRIQSA